MGNGTLVLTSSAAYYLTADPSSPTITEVQGLPAPITSVHSSANCDSLLGSEGEASALNYIVFAWADNATTSFYVSVDDGLTFTPLSIDVASPSGSGWNILSITLSHSYSRYMIAAQDAGDGTGALLLYNYKYTTWSTGATLPSSLASAGYDFSMEIPVTGSGTIYLWVDSGPAQDVYYSADGGVTLFSTPSLPSDIVSSTILSFDTSFFGSFAILAENSTTQTLVRELADVLVFSASTPPATAAVEVDFDSFGDPRVLSFTALGVTSSESSLTTSSSLPACPFLQMETNGTQRHYIDMGESFALLITLVSATTQDAYISVRDLGTSAVSVGVSDTTILDFALTFLGSSPYTPPITFTHELVVNEYNTTYGSYTNRTKYATGSTDVRITAKEVISSLS
jgi:hypothetical protein